VRANGAIWLFKWEASTPRYIYWFSEIWWSGRFLMKWPFLDEVVVSWWSGHFLIKFPIRQKRGTSSSSTKIDVENVPMKLKSSKNIHFIKKRRFLMKWPFLDDVAVSWWCGHFLMKWPFLDELLKLWRFTDKVLTLIGLYDVRMSYEEIIYLVPASTRYIYCSYIVVISSLFYCFTRTWYL